MYLSVTKTVKYIKGAGYIWPRGIQLFASSTQLSKKFSLLMIMKMPAIYIYIYLLADKLSCSATFSNKEFAVASNLRFISRKNG